VTKRDLRKCSVQVYGASSLPAIRTRTQNRKNQLPSYVRAYVSKKSMDGFLNTYFLRDSRICKELVAVLEANV